MKLNQLMRIYPIDKMANSVENVAMASGGRELLAGPEAGEYFIREWCG